MEHLKSKFTFFKAGQGSFYGGRICNQQNGRNYTIVYDCGTSTFIAGNSQSLNREIDLFKSKNFQFNHNNEIDLLFISHLDYDHVSGLKRLIKEFNIKNIILPYIEKEYRKFFLVSFEKFDETENKPSDDDLSIEDYILFIESPNTFIQNNSKEAKIYFVKPNDKLEFENKVYDNENQSEDIYPIGNSLVKTEELTTTENIFLYDNNLQFFIHKKWEFTTYVKSVSKEAITKLDDCLKKILNKSKNLCFEDLKRLVNYNRKEAHECYKKCVGDINSHGLVLLHGPIGFKQLYGKVYSTEEQFGFCDYRYQRFYYRRYNFISSMNNLKMGTLLFGDTSLKGQNKIKFPYNFKKKLVNVHIVQIPHHGSSKNWDFQEFRKLKIGTQINQWNNRFIAVCNFGFGNTYGHPSHHVLNDIGLSIFLNSQFSRLNIEYDIIYD